MRRTDRLFEIILIVRDGRLHLARDIAARLEVSIRTVYRDMESLIACGIPIEGGRGVGYLLREPVFLPPLTLTETELEALHFGLSVVANAADRDLQAAGTSLMAKIDQAIPQSRRAAPQSWGVAVYPFREAAAGFPHMPALRTAIRKKHKMRIAYRSVDGRATDRTIRPLQLEYWGRVWTCTAWCELRGDFRVFRIDLIEQAERLPEAFADEQGKTLPDYVRRLEKNDGA